jgi:hypothetical protein
MDWLLYYPNNLDAFPLNFLNIAAQQEAEEAVLALLQHDQYKLVQEFYGAPCSLVSRHILTY